MPKFKHIKRGSTYDYVGEAKVQTGEPLHDYDKVVIYRSDADGSLWVRPVSEFEERFEEVKEEEVVVDDGPESDDGSPEGNLFG